jgi:hypothetical protein
MQVSGKRRLDAQYPPRLMLYLCEKGIDSGMVLWYNSVKLEHHCADSIVAP